MTADNSPSRSLVIADANRGAAPLGPELEEAAGYARAEKVVATGRVGFCTVSLVVRRQTHSRPACSAFSACLLWAKSKHVQCKTACPLYIAGDKIYVFGFSRGAVAARALTEWICFEAIQR